MVLVEPSGSLYREGSPQEEAAFLADDRGVTLIFERVRSFQLLTPHLVKNLFLFTQMIQSASADISRLFYHDFLYGR